MNGQGNQAAAVQPRSKASGLQPHLAFSLLPLLPGFRARCQAGQPLLVVLPGEAALTCCCPAIVTQDTPLHRPFASRLVYFGRARRNQHRSVFLRPPRSLLPCFGGAVRSLSEPVL